MDSTLPQMPSIDFDRLDPIALEETLAYLRQHPEPPAEDIALYQGLWDDAVAESDWVEPFQDLSGQSSQFMGLNRSGSPSCNTPVITHFSKRHIYVSDGRMATEQSKALRFKPFLTPPPPRGNCTWDGCQGSQADGDLGAHLEVHARDALSRWARQSKCTWQGCKSKAKFKTLGPFKEHLENIHTKPLLCTKCKGSYKKPFKNKHELERHNSTKHSTERPWVCPYESCSSEIRTFARKDKWLKHIQEVQHENDAFCPYYHCYLSVGQSGKGFENRKEIGNHFSKIHAERDFGVYECALASCGKTRNCDRWSSDGLRKHVREQHKINFPYLSLLEEDPSAGGHIFRSQDVLEYQRDKFVDCNLCASQIEIPTLLDTATSTSHHLGIAHF